MNDRHIQQHLSAEAMQAFLDGALSGTERAAAEEHLASCARCSAELDGWRTLFERIGDLPTLAPGEDFAVRVLAGVELEERLSWAARVRERILGGSGHPSDERLQDFVEGLLPARRVARVRTHLDRCADCGARAESWGRMLAALGSLDRFEPSEGFAARVMAEVGVPAPAVAIERAPEWRRALAGLRRLVPQTRQAWATVSGVALTPAVTLGLVLWSVFTHPAVTPGALASFAAWKAADLASLAWGVLSAQVMGSAEAFGLFTFLQSLALTPLTLGAAFLAFSAGSVAAAWVLYKNLVIARPAGQRHAHASTS